ncbi:MULTISPECIES: hypothetical protein [Rhodococcus]|uniref:hypothetical protein n=1 Tax=Rhodococcus TaxID=1827 RepID=UPI001E3A1D93|nr:hypothetical protein [Rhodococcus pyridinivorans]MCD2116785.1 hypothetical protein [Rhodococcus pyridinivorans]MCZ4626007.1 hypothetical protein [Rhodococcus pyridinivorans]MCZ4646962.1 hypothetical protein [Rhodococcus pyridinivorans]MDJ0480314.1 hypothetical protein [Rhodococcus pyridinivorans]MDV7253065.1 hypothetical protein [Rhodococcus pyridinivorans]
MTSRHDLVDLILMALDDPRATSIEHVSATAGRRARVENGIDAILDRYAVVELPEPDIAEGLHPEWSYDDSHRSRRVGLMSGSGHEIAVGSGQFHTVETARALAAALLAAADRAEARR